MVTSENVCRVTYEASSLSKKEQYSWVWKETMEDEWVYRYSQVFFSSRQSLSCYFLDTFPEIPRGSTNSQSCDANFAHVVYRENGLEGGISTSPSSTRNKIFPFRYACAYACVRAATSENEIPLRHDTSTRIFTTRGYVWPIKTLGPHYRAPKQFGRFGKFCLCMCLCRNSFSPGSSPLFALVSLVKNRL